MNTDKLIIAAAAAIVLTAFSCKDIILNDVVLYRQIEKASVKIDQDFEPVQYYPLTIGERANVIEELIARMNELQLTVSHSTFIKYGVDFHKQMNELKALLVQVESEFASSEDYLTFLTARENRVYASLEFPKDQLLQLGSLIDEMQPAKAEAALYALTLEEGYPVLDIGPLYPPNESLLYQTFIDRVSNEIFPGERVFLRVTHAEPDDDEIFEAG